MREFRITEKTEKESVILCGGNALREAAALHGRKMIFTDSNVYALYKDRIEGAFQSAPVFVMEAGEEHKTEQTLFALLRAMAEANLHRNDMLVCVGGGVAGDIGGLASALYMRGIALVQVPTTLLAQVDSSVGGKTAVDFNGVKNLVGTFKQPDRVFVDGSFLKTLSLRELRCGLGEIVKHAALDEALFDKLTNNRNRLFELEFLENIVPDNIAVKADVVRRDAREAGLRKCLNLGHTTAHAFELSHKKLSHGEYVLTGLIYEAEIAKRLTESDGDYLNELEALARSVLGEWPALPSAEEAAPLARLDKKNTQEENVSLSVPVRRGKYAFLDLPYREYERLLKEIGRELC